MTLRSLTDHNAEKQAQYTDSEHLRDVGIPLGIECPADNCHWRTAAAAAV